jgi:hypothetical protein
MHGGGTSYWLHVLTKDLSVQKPTGWLFILERSYIYIRTCLYSIVLRKILQIGVTVFGRTILLIVLKVRTLQVFRGLPSVFKP